MVSINGVEFKLFKLNAEIISIFNKINERHPNIIIKHSDTIDAIKYDSYLVNANLKIRAITNCGKMFGEPLEFDSPINMRKIIFKGDVILQCDFEQDVSFKNCEFYGNFSASNCRFQSNVYFNNAIFNNYADFHESTFNQTACFYGVTFKEVPNFSQTIFNGNLNLVNSNLKFNFDKCDNVVDIERKRREYKVIKHYDKDKVANDFRDSFRGFKSALIENNNLLDASNYHKIELYFKEIELDSKKPKPFSKEWIDLWQLKFYRATSDHHTDLLKIVVSLILLIGSFVAVIFIDKNLDNLFDKKVIRSIFGVILILSLIYKYSKKAFLDFFILLSCISCIWLLGNSPNLIFGVADLLIKDNKNSFTLNLIISVYMILFILLIFSLQKTARKNSIIPS